MSAVPSPCVGKRIERHPNSSITDSMHVDLEAIPVQRSCHFLQRLWLIDGPASVSPPIAIGSEQCGSPGFDHAVRKELDRGWAHSPAGKTCAQSPEPWKHAVRQRLTEIEPGNHGSVRVPSRCAAEY